MKRTLLIILILLTLIFAVSCAKDTVLPENVSPTAVNTAKKLPKIIDETVPEYTLEGVTFDSRFISVAQPLDDEDYLKIIKDADYCSVFFYFFTGDVPKVDYGTTEQKLLPDISYAVAKFEFIDGVWQRR